MDACKTRAMGKVMREFRAGKLHSGTKGGPLVHSRDQALAIALAKVRKECGAKALKQKRRAKK